MSKPRFTQQELQELRLLLDAEGASVQAREFREMVSTPCAGNACIGPVPRLREGGEAMTKKPKPRTSKFRFDESCRACPVLKREAELVAAQQVLEECVRLGYMDRVDAPRCSAKTKAKRKP